jgi:PAS domain-containing protein
MSQRIRAFAQTTTYLGVVMIVAIWAGVYFLGTQAYDRAYEDGLRQGSNMARVFEEYIARAISGIDSELLVLRKLYQQDPAHFRFDDWIDGATMRNNLTVHFSVTGANGILKLSSLGPIRSTIDLSEREPFRVHIDSTTDELYISQPAIGHLSGKASIQLTRRLPTPDGSFDGIIGASLDIVELEKFYNSIDIGREGIIALVGFDGVIRARSGRDAAAKDYVGQSLSGRAMFWQFRKSPAGSLWNSGNSTNIDGVKRLISYRVVDGLPLLASVGQTEADIFRQAEATTRRYEQIGLLLTAIVLVAIAIGARRQLNLVAAGAALERSRRSLEQTNVLFDTALENMAHGLCMFDGDQRLLVCNARYGEMYGLPPELIRRGTTLRALLETRVAMGTCPQEAEHFVEERLEEVAKSEPGTADAGDHRVGPDAGEQREPRNIASTARPRHLHRARRFRNRLFLAQLSPIVPVRPDQDRPVVRERAVEQRGLRRDRVRGREPGPQPADRNRRRRRRDRGPARARARRRLHACAGLLVRPPMRGSGARLHAAFDPKPEGGSGVTRRRKNGSRVHLPMRGPGSRIDPFQTSPDIARPASITVAFSKGF